MSARLTGFFTGVGDVNRPKVMVWELMDMMAMVRGGGAGSRAPPSLCTELTRRAAALPWPQVKAKMEEMKAKLAAVKAIAMAKLKAAKQAAELAKAVGANEAARLASMKECVQRRGHPMARAVAVGAAARGCSSAPLPRADSAPTP